MDLKLVTLITDFVNKNTLKMYNATQKTKSNMKNAVNAFIAQQANERTQAIVIDAETLMSSNSLANNGVPKQNITVLNCDETIIEKAIQEGFQAYAGYSTQSLLQLKGFYDIIYLDYCGTPKDNPANGFSPCMDLAWSSHHLNKNGILLATFSRRCENAIEKANQIIPYGMHLVKEITYCETSPMYCMILTNGHQTRELRDTFNKCYMESKKPIKTSGRKRTKLVYEKYLRKDGLGITVQDINDHVEVIDVQEHSDFKIGDIIHSVGSLTVDSVETFLHALKNVRKLHMVISRDSSYNKKFRPLYGIEAVNRINKKRKRQSVPSVPVPSVPSVPSVPLYSVVKYDGHEGIVYRMVDNCAKILWLNKDDFGSTTGFWRMDHTKPWSKIRGYTIDKEKYKKIKQTVGQLKKLGSYKPLKELLK